MERRDLLRGLGAAAALTLFPEDVRSAWARASIPIRPVDGLTDAQLAVVATIADVIIPRTDTPGALDVRVPAFVLVPKNLSAPAPAIVALHDHGGFYLWGKEKLVEVDELRALPVAGGAHAGLEEVALPAVGVGLAGVAPHARARDVIAGVVLGARRAAFAAHL